MSTFNIIDAFSEIAGHTRLMTDLKEAIKNKAFYEDASSFFRIQPGIKGGSPVVALDGMEYVTKASTGCGGTADSFTIGGIKQVWNPKLQEVKIKICYSEFMDAFTRWGLGNGVGIKDLNESNLIPFITDMVTDAMRADFLRMALFADANIATQNILTDEDKAVYYNTFDRGLIPTLQYLKTQSSLAENFDTLSKNNEVTRALQMSLSSDYAVNLFEKLTEDAYFDGDIILTSHSLLKNYKNYLRRGGDNTPLQSSKDEIQKGLESLKFDGDALVASKFYDMKRKTDFTVLSDHDDDDDTATVPVTHLPHFAIYTNKDNLVVGIDDTSALENLQLEYVGGSDEHFYIKANYQMDFKIPNPTKLRAAL